MNLLKSLSAGIIHAFAVSGYSADGSRRMFIVRFGGWPTAELVLVNSAVNVLPNLDL